MMLAYHEFSGDACSDVYAISATTFRQHALLVKRHCGTNECITFDDGHRSQFEAAAPILDELRIPAIFFITTSWVETRKSALTWDQLRELHRAGYSIGAHSHTHKLLTLCNDAELIAELVVSKQMLEDRLGAGIDCLSLPGGRRNRRVLEACAQAGYNRVYTSRVGEYSKPCDGLSEIIGRFVVTHSTSERTLAAYLMRRQSMIAQLQMKAAVRELIKRAVGDSFYQWAWRRAFRAESIGADASLFQGSDQRGGIS